MNTLTGGLKKTTDGLNKGVSGVTSGVNQGVEGVTSGLNAGVQGVASAVVPDSQPQSGSNSENKTPAVPESARDGPNKIPETAKVPEGQQPSAGGFMGGITGGISSGFKGIGSGVVTGVSAVGTTTGDALKSGGALATDATNAGFKIGEQIGKSGLDLTQNVAGGVTDLTGTALGGIVDMAAQTSGAVFEPIGSGLKTLEGLQGIGPGIEFINGLPMGAVKQIGDLTLKALNMSGKTPTFFDSNADGIVGIPDTTKGLIVLGLDEKTAGYAAMALHTVFSYPTSESWVPGLDKTMPIRVANMHKTRWGRNWGNFERLDWVDDVQMDDFFKDAEKDRAKSYAEYATQARQYFGILLLIFEWGTTWPFLMPDVPVQEIPFSGEMGKVVRKAILPTILGNFQKARAADPNAKKSEKPTGGPPTDAKEA